MTAIFYSEGFNTYDPANFLVFNPGSGWTATGFGARAKISATAPRNGPYSMLIDGGTGTGAGVGENVSYVFPAGPVGNPTFQWAFNLHINPSQTNGSGLSWYNAGGDHIDVCYNTIGQFVLMANGVVLYTSLASDPNGVWISYGLTIHVNGVLDLYRDNQVIGSFPSGVFISSIVYMMAGIVNNGTPVVSSGGGQVFCDDLVGGTAGFLFDCAVINLFPSGNGALQDWTPSAGNAWQRIDNAPFITTEYIEATAAGNISDFNCLSPTATIAAVHDVATQYIASRTAAGVESMRARLKQGITVVSGATVVPPVGSQNQFVEHYNINPITASGWTPADLVSGATQLGFERVT